ncbi:MAG TPA: hypothetical protein VMD02_01530 [Candidatus Omnitrophota bacterium]|nr:hypothetical protein [Candidatus Omnitrophota bacterium]
MKRAFLFASLFLLLAAPCCYAGRISLVTTVTSEVAGATLNVSLSVINSGDEAARRFSPHINAAGRTVSADRANALSPGATYRTALKFDLKSIKPGIYPLLIVLNYEDANQHPFSALVAQTYKYGATLLPLTSCEITPVRLSGTARTEVKVMNGGGKGLAGSVKLFLPNELKADPNGIKMDLLGGSEKNFSFTLRNLSALNGSSYQIFAIIEYDLNDFHQTVITPGTVSVTAPGSLLDISTFQLLYIFITLIVILIAVQFVPRIRK